MRAFHPLADRSPTAGRRRASSATSGAAPGGKPLSPLNLDPAFSNIITESPQSTSTSHAYPPTAIPPAAYPSPYLPRTPTHNPRDHPSQNVEDSLSQVDESGTEREYPTISQSSRAPLLVVKERDYADEEAEGVRATRNGRAGQDDEDADPGAYVFMDSPAQTPGRVSPAGRGKPIGASRSLAPLQQPKQRTVDPSYLPRPGPADAYISRFLAPIPMSAGTQPPSPEPTDGPSSFLVPAAPLRAASAPGVPLASLNTSLAQTANGPPTAEEEESSDHPLFKMFSAQLDVTADEMVRRLKGHLGEVLRVQEEVGAMHLKLEGLGMSTGPGGGMGLGIKTGGKDGEKDGGGGDGVKEMVDRREKGVEEIMEKLGALSDTLRGYHHLGTPKLSFPPSSKPSSAYPYSAAQSPMTPVPSPPSANPVSATSPTTPSSRHPPGHPLGSPPKIHANHGLGGSRNFLPISPRQQQRHAPKVPSNLDQVTTADEEEEDDSPPTMIRGLSPARAGAGAERDRAKGGDVWLERRKQDLGGGAERFHASPMEMADRSRPW